MLLKHASKKDIYIKISNCKTAAIIPLIRRNARHLVWDFHPRFPHQCYKELTLPQRWEHRRRTSQLVHSLVLLAAGAGREKQDLSARGVTKSEGFN